jgi:peptidoglycan hydrolase-like protein with peptidoglycan-binding domain
MGGYVRTVVKSSAAALCGVAAIVLATTVTTPSYAQAPSMPAKSMPAKSAKAAKPAMAKKATADSKVMAVQEALVKQGYKVKVDGMMGKKTRSAIRKFQAKNKLKATGRIDEQTLSKLGVS